MKEDNNSLEFATDSPQTASTRSAYATVLGSAALGAGIMPMTFFELTPPSWDAHYLAEVLPVQAGIGGFLGFAAGATIAAINLIKKNNQGNQ